MLEAAWEMSRTKIEFERPQLPANSYAIRGV